MEALAVPFRTVAKYVYFKNVVRNGATLRFKKARCDSSLTMLRQRTAKTEDAGLPHISLRQLQDGRLLATAGAHAGVLVCDDEPEAKRRTDASPSVA